MQRGWVNKYYLTEANDHQALHAVFDDDGSTPFSESHMLVHCEENISHQEEIIIYVFCAHFTLLFCPFLHSIPVHEWFDGWKNYAHLFSHMLINI